MEVFLRGVAPQTPDEAGAGRKPVGYAFSFDVADLRVAVVDRSGTDTGRILARAFRDYEKFRPVDLPVPGDASLEAIGEGARDRIRLREADMVILLPPGFGEPGEEARLRVLIDGSQLFTAQAGARLLQEAMEGVLDEVQEEIRDDLRAEVVREAEARLRARGMVTMLATTLLVALGIVREREYGTLEQLAVTPIRPLELVLGKLLPYVLLAAVDFVLVLAAGLYLFGLEPAGSLALFSAPTLLFLLSTVGLGVLVSTVSQNQQQAMQLAFFVMFPQILISGLIFPISSMPRAIQWISTVLPFTYFVPIARGIFLKGQGLDVLWPQAAVLAGYGVLLVAVATVRLRRRLAA